MNNIQLQIPAHITGNCLNPKTQKVWNPGLSPRILQISTETSTAKKIPKSGNGECTSFPFAEDVPGATTLQQRKADGREMLSIHSFSPNYCWMSKEKQSSQKMCVHQYGTISELKPSTSLSSNTGNLEFSMCSNSWCDKPKSYVAFNKGLFVQERSKDFSCSSCSPEFSARAKEMTYVPNY